MKIPANIKIERAVSTSAAQARLQNPWLETDPIPAIIASDGCMLAYVPIPPDDDVAGPIPLKAIEVSREDYRPVILNAAYAHSVVTKAGVAFSRPPDKPPRWRNIMPQGEPDFYICLQPHLLLKLADALGAEHGVVIGIHRPTGNGSVPPFVITPGDNPFPQGGTRPIGYLMPVRLQGVVGEKNLQLPKPDAGP
jgi:hypothetical protein